METKSQFQCEKLMVFNEGCKIIEDNTSNKKYNFVAQNSIAQSFNIHTLNFNINSVKTFWYTLI
jgi:hypothetical protein